MGEVLMGTLNLNVNLYYKTTECFTCGITIAMPSDLYNRRLKDGKYFYCPKGHSQYFIQGQTKEEQLQKQLKIAHDSNAFLRKQNEQERNRTRGQKAAKTRIKNRITNGVCPCCNRTFKQLARHMKNKHPDYMGHKK